MDSTGSMEATSVTRMFDNAIIGEGAVIEPDVTVGFRYDPKCGPARIGDNCLLRKGALIYGDVIIGDHFQAAYYSVIRAMVKIGSHCTLFNRSTIEGIVRMGDSVRIMAHVYIPSRTWFGDNVFVGPGVTFLNDRYPCRRDPPPPPRGATIENDVMIGGGCTILPGVTIGERSFIAAGAVVSKDVPPRSFVVGVPGRISPLPDHLDMPNIQEFTGSQEIWHPESEYLGESIWPDYWPEPFS
jgi:acetyltransferase-like isoleucine patch superfamily enzyme